MTTADESIFRYNDGITHANFSFRNFTPKFLDEANQTLVAEANRICNNVQQCVFDYVFTGNRDLATYTAATETQSGNIADQIGNL